MSRTTEGLIECFRRDDISEMSMAQIIDFGFRGLKNEAQVYIWFAVLKDLYDHLKKTFGHYKAVDAIHEAVITGSLKSTVMSAAEGYTQESWPRFFDPEVPDILNRVHRETSIYRKIQSERFE